MAGKFLRRAPGPWGLAADQHGLLTRGQLLDLGFSRKAIEHRIRTGRLHRVGWGVYAVGRPQLTLHGRWMAAVLGCGAGAVLSHASAAALWGLRPVPPGAVEVSVVARRARRREGIVVHRRERLQGTVRRHGIPVTSPVTTLIDIAPRLGTDQLEAAVNQADKKDVIDPESLLVALDDLGPRPGVAALRAILERPCFVLTDSALERRFLRLVRRAGLPAPRTGVHVNGYKVDFYWPQLGLVVETDGLRYHRTPVSQARDRLRDQAHAAAGTTALRFTYAQVRFEPLQVERTLLTVARRLATNV